MENALNDFRELLAVETAKIDRTITETHSASISFLASRGILNSSGGMIKVTRDAADTIPMHCQTAFTLLLRTLTAHGVQVDQSNKDAVAAVLRTWIEERLLQLKALVSITAPMAHGNPAQNESYLKEIDERGNLEIRRIAGEIALIAAAQGREKPGQQNFSMVFNGQVGVVQTGAGSFGTANQNIDQGASEALIAALSKILALATQDDSPQRDDVLELVADARSELEKDKPNALKVKSLVSGLGDALSLMPKLKEGYDVLKWAGSFVGVNLP
ncbi:hypothetical protein [Rhizobium leguminosarum]|uniref:hypothetical protein n=1 Tax=Rhizobium leguminosarum TaxID=384 RepID=UPI001C94D292|nr:hypothetical protein [Rhizobium leguminosarum]MBY5666628.1 hypothetical protein [Rhizobium leguminosarum]MBY5680079.1 hypothetical protein [Rhizobium leguminosarum]